MRSPYEFLVASGRLLARDPGTIRGRYLGGLNVLGQPLWSPAGPNGFPDTNAAWAAPEGMKLRLDISAQIASRLGDSIDPRELLELVAADAASAETRRTDRARGIAAAGAGAVADVAGIPEEIDDGTAARACKLASQRRRRACCSAAPPLRPGPICRNSRAPPTAAIRGWSSSSCAARWTGSPPSRRSAIPIMPACTARSRCRSSGPNAALPLDSFFAPASGDAGISRGCIARRRPRWFTRSRPSYRERSHFDGQDVLESGFAGPGRVQSGWLNRALEALPRGERVTSALAVGPTTPLVLRGAAPTVGWAPVGVAAGRRGYRDAAGRALSPARSRAGERADAGPAARQGRARRRHEAEARHQWRRLRCGWWRAAPPS